MPLQIVRNDITKMEVDAIVNSTNTHLVGAGIGVDGCIHEAAGPKLDEALAEIGHCDLCCAVITPSFGITNCRYIIHTVAPRYRGQNVADLALLERTYTSVFELALENGCQSLALPILSAGNHGWPRETAYRACTEAAHQFLLKTESDMEIYIVTFSSKMAQIAGLNEKLDEESEQLAKCQEALNGLSANMYIKPRKRRRRPTQSELDCLPEGALNALYGAHSGKPGLSPCEEQIIKEEKCEIPPCYDMAAASEDTVPITAKADEPDYHDLDKSFCEMCDYWREKRGLSATEFYVNSNITKGTFWNMKKHPESQPKRTSVYACVIGLKLSLEEAEDLIKRAGYVLSPYYLFDRRITDFIERGNYSIDDINLKLFDDDLPLLGSGTYD